VPDGIPIGVRGSREQLRQLIGAQDEINKRRSKSLHLLMNRQIRSTKGSIDDIDASGAFEGGWT
jgi:hypothetical protein